MPTKTQRTKNYSFVVVFLGFSPDSFDEKKQQQRDVVELEILTSALAMDDGCK